MKFAVGWWQWWAIMLAGTISIRAAQQREFTCSSSFRTYYVAEIVSKLKFIFRCNTSFLSYSWTSSNALSVLD